MLPERKEKEKRFRKKLVLFLESYRNENNIKGGPSGKKIVADINSQDLQNIAKNLWNTKNSYDKANPKNGGKRSRGRRRRRKKKTRKKKRGGMEIEDFIALSSVVIMVGTALAVHFIWPRQSPFTRVETPEDTSVIPEGWSRGQFQDFLRSEGPHRRHRGL